jgi:acyl transferase domain-containing protein
VSHAFHSPLMESIVADFRCELDGLEPQPTEFPLFSTVLGRQVDGREMTADYWAQQICSPVRFYDALRAAVNEVGADYLAEAGPRTALLALARQCDLPSPAPMLPLCSGRNSDGTELLGVAATLIRDGYSPELDPLYGEPAGPLQRVPPYVFDDTSRFWFDGPIAYPGHGTRFGQVEMTTPPAVEQADTEQSHDNAEDEVLALIADVGNYSVAALARSKRLADDLGYDSLLQLRLLDRLRTEYPQLQQVDVTELLPKIHKVGDLVDFVVHQLDKTA